MKYTSIDIDFFNDIATTDETDAYLDYIFQTVKECSIPCVAVMNHQQLIPFVNACPARQLINLDEHSDLGNEEETWLDCGSWVNYITWRNRGEYVWLHAGSLIAGECSGGDKPIFTDKRSIGNKNCGWKKSSHKRINTLPTIPALLSSCFGVGFCLSPSFRINSLEPVFHRIVKKYKIPYLKGRRNEHFGVHRKPCLLKD
jgi:hypothetical protein